MEKRLPKLIGVAMFTLLVLSCLVAIQVRAQEEGDIPVPGSIPVYVILNAEANGNYPGGNEFFSVTVVNSDISGDITITNATLTATALGPNGVNTGIGLPATLMTGQSYATNIALQIPANFTQTGFEASLVVRGTYANGTGQSAAEWTGNADVSVFQLSASSQTTSLSVTGTTGTVSSTVFAAGVALPTIVAIILLVLLVRQKPVSKPAGTQAQSPASTA
jgi:hypothetical protein